jgi:hypothetical protein
VVWEDALVEEWVVVGEEEAAEEEVWEAEVEVAEVAVVDAKVEESMLADDAVDIWLAVLAVLPELEASFFGSVTLNCCDWAKIPPEGERKLTW